MSATGQPASQATFANQNSSVFTYNNTESDEILITDDKLKLKLIKFRDDRRVRTAWIAPFSVALTLIIALTTAEFHETYGLKPDTLKGAAITALICVGVWLLIELIRLGGYLWRYWKLSDIDEFIAEIKKEVTAQKIPKTRRV